MMSISIIPAIDLRDGRCVRLTQGRKDETTIYDGDPIDIALSYETSGAQMIHLVDLDAAFGRGSNAELLVRVVSQLDVNVELSGGIRER